MPIHENETPLLQGSGPDACAFTEHEFCPSGNCCGGKQETHCTRLFLLCQNSDSRTDFWQPPIWRATILPGSYTYQDPARKVDGWLILFWDDSAGKQNVLGLEIPWPNRPNPKFYYQCYICGRLVAPSEECPMHVVSHDGGNVTVRRTLTEDHLLPDSRHALLVMTQQVKYQ